MIKLHSNDSRLHVKKAISWALREIGKISYTFREKAAFTAYELCENADKNRKWIGKESLKELEKLVSIDERRRLISSDTKMGKQRQ